MATKTVNKLQAREMFKLAEFVKAEYVERAQTDVEFAKHATEKLGFMVNARNIAAARAIFDLPSTVAARVQRAGKATVRISGEVYGRIRNLEAQVAELMAFKKRLEG